MHSKRIRQILSIGLLLLVGWQAVHWYQQRPQQLTANQSHPGDLFGYTMAIANDRLAVSAWGDDSGGEKAGAIYIFHKEGEAWREAGKLIAPDAQPYAYFGASIALSADTLAVTACEQASFSRSGNVYIYSLRNGIWQLTQKIPLLGCARTANLLAIDNKLLVVGLHNARTARLFTHNGDEWQKTADLKPSAVFHYSITDPFAHLKAVATNGTRVVLGLDDGAGAYVCLRPRYNWGMARGTKARNGRF